MSSNILDKVVGYFKNKKIEKEKILIEQEKENEFNIIYNNVLVYSHLKEFEDLKDILHSSHSKTITDNLKERLEHALKGLSYKVLMKSENIECLTLMLKYNSFYTNSFVNTVILSYLLTDFSNCFQLEKNELNEYLKKENLVNFLDSYIKCLNIKKDVNVIKSNFIKHNFDIKYLHSIVIS